MKILLNVLRCRLEGFQRSSRIASQRRVKVHHLIVIIAANQVDRASEIHDVLLIKHILEESKII